MQIKRLNILLFLGIFLVLVGCGKTQPANKTITDSRSSWYLYQSENGNDSNVTKLNFYSDKTVGVKNISLIGDTHGSNILNRSFGNPTYRTNSDGKEIIINTLHPRMIFALQHPYHENIHGYQLKGYTVTYQGSNWNLGKITKTDKKVVKNYRNKEQKKRLKRRSDSDALGHKLMNYVVNPRTTKATKSTKMNGKDLTGEYSYRANINKSRVYGHLSILKGGIYTNTLFIHAKQNKKNKNQDNPTIMQQQTTTGYLQSLYGKLYLKPLNLLTVDYFTQGQNEKNPVVKNLKLDTDTKKYGNNIDLSRTRLEFGDDGLMMFNRDLDVWATSDQKDVSGILLYKSQDTQASLKSQYNQIYEHYQQLKKTPIKSNSDLRQYVGAVSAKNNSTIAGIGVDMGGKFSISQSVDNYIGVDKSGNKQEPMDYIALITPAILQTDKNSRSVTTADGSFLIFGVRDNKLYLLQQPDQDSSTITWSAFRDFPIKLPEANITLNK